MESINTGVEFYSNVKASEVEWVWYPYIPCGKITMLQGDPGEGKSTLIIHVAAILTKGGYLPDGQKIKKPEMVIYQCSEDGKGDTIKPRLEQAGADCNRVAFIKEDNDKLTLEDERIRNAIIQISAKMVVLDPIQAFIGHNGNMTNVVKMREILSKLSKVAAETNCAIVLVGHMTYWIEIFANNKEIRNHYGNAGSEYYLKNLTINCKVNELNKVINDVVGKNEY